MSEHKIKYSTISETQKYISVLEKDNCIDLTFLGEITQLRLPNSILKSKNKLKYQFILKYFSKVQKIILIFFLIMQHYLIHF